MSGGRGREWREFDLFLDVGRSRITYVSGAALARIEPASGHEFDLLPLTASGRWPQLLGSPGESVEVRALHRGRLRVTLRGVAPGQPLKAALKLERFASQAPGEPDFKLLAHITRRGDIVVSPGHWAAGPEAPAAIEGLEVRDWRAEHCDLEIQARIASSPPRWLDWSGAGVFVGTRGEALALTGIRLRLSGQQVNNWRMAADALFLGDTVQQKVGQEVELTGPASSDPLVGLRLSLTSYRKGALAAQPVDAHHALK